MLPMNPKNNTQDDERIGRAVYYRWTRFYGPVIGGTGDNTPGTWEEMTAAWGTYTVAWEAYT